MSAVRCSWCNKIVKKHYKAYDGRVCASCKTDFATLDKGLEALANKICRDRKLKGGKDE